MIIDDVGHLLEEGGPFETEEPRRFGCLRNLQM